MPPTPSPPSLSASKIIASDDADGSLDGHTESECLADQLAASRRMCRKIAGKTYENFLVGSLFLPQKMRQPFFDVYAFCRTADDLADASDSREDALAGLADYRKRIESVFQNGPSRGIFVALADTVAKFHLPRKPFDDLLDAFEQDQHISHYDDEPQLLDYCSRSANPVGHLVLAMADSDTPENVVLADQICTALQLANFWQDVARDFQMGRTYLPATVMQRHGFDSSLIAQTLQHDAPTPGLIRNAIAEVCTDARSRFQKGMALVERVPRWLSADVSLFARGGLATLDAIERIEYDVLRTRPTVGKRRQAGLMLQTLWGKWFA